MYQIKGKHIRHSSCKHLWMALKPQSSQSPSSFLNHQGRLEWHEVHWTVTRDVDGQQQLGISLVVGQWSSPFRVITHVHRPRSSSIIIIVDQVPSYLLCGHSKSTWPGTPYSVLDYILWLWRRVQSRAWLLIDVQKKLSGHEWVTYVSHQFTWSSRVGMWMKALWVGDHIMANSKGSRNPFSNDILKK